ncbi:MAG: 2-amino-4-hydroxy-6-hydroxymethyldihydropteridine diphosphokinase [Bacteroidales bacterium]|nr:2-amino-4-hydroxy-6-hydroxymethyldihydropteridine diphosphokinase [Bacteroidales bacterium]
MHKCFLLLGSNTGEKRKTIESALKAIGGTVGEIKKKSSYYHSQPWGFNSDEDFLNVVVIVETEKSPDEILQLILEIETALGRKRTGKPGYQSRTLDIDILFYNDEIINRENLYIPHPRMHLRRFTLEPVNELEPDFVHPVIKKSIAELLIICPDKLLVSKDSFLKNEKPSLCL